MIFWYAFSGITIWLLILSVVLFITRGHYRHLVADTKKGTLDEVLDYLRKRERHISSEIDKIDHVLKTITDTSRVYYQKIGFVRFNPFERLAGEQSFVIGLFDGEKSGIVITFLYTRDGMRIYAKRVKKGISEDHPLSKEEEEAVKKAR